MNFISTSSMNGQRGLNGMPGRNNNGGKAGLTYVLYSKTIPSPGGGKDIYKDYLMDP